MPPRQASKVKVAASNFTCSTIGGQSVESAPLSWKHVESLLTSCIQHAIDKTPLRQASGDADCCYRGEVGSSC